MLAPSALAVHVPLHENRSRMGDDPNEYSKVEVVEPYLKQSVESAPG